MDQAFVYSWTERERGFGQRPDGLSVHVSEQEARNYVARHFASMPSEAPDEYEQPDSDIPFGVVLQDAAFARLLAEKKSMRLRPRQAVVEHQADGRRVLVIRDTALLLAEVEEVGAKPGTPVAEVNTPTSKAASATATRALVPEIAAAPEAGEPATFVDLCLRKLAKPEDFRSFVDRWHRGEGRQFANIWAFLGLTQDEFYALMENEGNVYEVLFKRVLARNPLPTYALHVKSDGHYVVHFEGLHEATQKPMVAYQGLDGQVWFRDKELFTDGRFKPLA
jgi:hypothetical protein